MSRVPIFILVAVTVVTGCTFMPDAPPQKTSEIVTSGQPLELHFSHSVGTGGYYVRFQPQSTGVQGNLTITVKNVGNHYLTAMTRRQPLGSADDRSEYLKPGQSFQIFEGSAPEFFNHWHDITISSPEKGPLPVGVTLSFRGSPSPLALIIEDGLYPRPSL